jgi:hypothetical protein
MNRHALLQGNVLSRDHNRAILARETRMVTDIDLPISITGMRTKASESRWKLEIADFNKLLDRYVVDNAEIQPATDESESDSEVTETSQYITGEVKFIQVE